MICQQYQLDDKIMKTTDPLKLWQSEKGLVEVDKGALATGIRLDQELKGYVFHGRGRLVLDTIVETKDGAIGKPVEKEITEPLLMLGATEETQRHLTTATDEDLTERGYGNQKEFAANTERLFDRFLGRGRMHTGGCCGESRGTVFAFADKTHESEILVADDAKIVYKASNMVFVSDGNKVLMKRPDHTILMNSRGSFVFGE
jgi:hypothetical protein